MNARTVEIDLVSRSRPHHSLVTSSLLFCRHIHSHALACRTLDPTKILVMNKTRLLLNCGGIFDVITFDPAGNSGNSAGGNGGPTSQQMSHFQQEDLISLGKIVLGESDVESAEARY